MPLIALATAAFGAVSLITSLWDRSGRQQHAIARTWAGVLLKISLSRVQVIGTENIPAGSTAVYASNHLSYMDTPLLFAKLPFQFRILAKQGLWKVPFIGWHLHRSGQVPVDQSSARSAVASLGRGVAALKAGLPLVIFPEGGRSEDGQLKPMLSGAAYMAIRAQVPLVPVTLVGTYELLPIHTTFLRPGKLLLHIGKPFETLGKTTKDADSLTSELSRLIHSTYETYSAKR
jgi:1-acyl-sn-glycerol-3-phosphate acyltransferase